MLGVALIVTSGGVSGALVAADAIPKIPGPTDSPFDPLRGMDANGRIPKVILPADIPNPERWRYIPEGRIKPGSPIDRFMVTDFIYPTFDYEKNVGAGGGIALTDIDFREQRRREFAAVFLSHTTEGQERYAVLWKRWLHSQDLPGGGVIQEERSAITANASYIRTLTTRFYGFGSHTIAGDETSYTDEATVVSCGLEDSLPRPGDNVVMVFGLRGEYHNLARGHVTDRPNTGDLYPELVAAGDSHSSLWLSTGLGYDTRDSQSNPYHGWMIQGLAETVPVETGGDQGARFTVRGSLTIPLPGLFHDGGDAGEENPPTDTIAIGAMTEWTAGTLPFWALPSLGGRDTLRGYIGNRFTDRAAWHASIEYRFWPVPRGFAITDSIRIERLGLAPFYELGSVADRLGNLSQARVHDSVGIGLRIGLERASVFRCDVGFSHEGSAVTIAYGLSY
ncbi:MAG: BamA/TamA family outer membrane protein [Planctomycetes bacterium]|nr:BamA/TamA family outer membrane protein [Planctomycetota bacterium]